MANGKEEELLIEDKQVNPNYWYASEDIGDLLDFYITEYQATANREFDLYAIPFDGISTNVFIPGQIIHFIYTFTKNKPLSDKPRKFILPINLGGNHWVTAVISEKNNGLITLEYSNSLGKAVIPENIKTLITNELTQKDLLEKFIRNLRIESIKAAIATIETAIKEKTNTPDQIIKLEEFKKEEKIENIKSSIVERAATKEEIAELKKYINDEEIQNIKNFTENRAATKDEIVGLEKYINEKQIKNINDSLIDRLPTENETNALKSLNENKPETIHKIIQQLTTQYQKIEFKNYEHTLTQNDGSSCGAYTVLNSFNCAVENPPMENPGALPLRKEHIKILAKNDPLKLQQILDKQADKQLPKKSMSSDDKQRIIDLVQLCKNPPNIFIEMKVKEIFLFDTNEEHKDYNINSRRGKFYTEMHTSDNEEQLTALNDLLKLLYNLSAGEIKQATSLPQMSTEIIRTIRECILDEKKYQEFLISFKKEQIRSIDFSADEIKQGKESLASLTSGISSLIEVALQIIALKDQTPKQIAEQIQKLSTKLIENFKESLGADAESIPKMLKAVIQKTIEKLKITALQNSPEKIYEGIGAIADFTKNTGFVVTEIYQNTPASAIGLLVGDIMTHVTQDGTEIDIRTLSLEDARMLVRGRSGERLILKVLRGDEAVTLGDKSNNSRNIINPKYKCLYNPTISSAFKENIKKIEEILFENQDTKLLFPKDNFAENIVQKGDRSKSFRRIIKRALTEINAPLLDDSNKGKFVELVKKYNDKLQTNSTAR